MRIAGFALLGFLSGAIFGLIGAVLFTTLWYDVLGIGRPGPDGMAGVGTLVGLALVLPPAGGIIGAAWLGARARNMPTGGPSCAMLVALILAPLLLLLVALLFAAG